MSVLYDKYISLGKSDSDAIKAAGQDAGRMLKQVLSADLRQFDSRSEELIKKYRWV